MSDGRFPRGPLYSLLRGHFKLVADLDICAAIYGQAPGSRSGFAQLAGIVADAARNGDEAARSIFTAGAHELAAIVAATRTQLQAAPDVSIPVSYSGGMFKLTDLVLEPFRAALRCGSTAYDLTAPKLPPAAGAALYAAKCSGAPLSQAAVATLSAQLK